MGVNYRASMSVKSFKTRDHASVTAGELQAKTQETAAKKLVAAMAKVHASPDAIARAKKLVEATKKAKTASFLAKYRSAA